MANATTLSAGTAYLEAYFVTVSNPSFPGYALPIAGGDESWDGVTGPVTTTTIVPSLLLSARAQTDIGQHKAETTAIGISRANAPSVLIPSQGTNPIPIFTQERVSSFGRRMSAASSVTDSFTATATQSAQANLYAASNLGIRLSLSDAPNNWYGVGGPQLGGISVYSSISLTLDDMTPDVTGMATRQRISQLDATAGLGLRNLSLVNTTVVDIDSVPFYTYDALVTTQHTVLRDGVPSVSESNIADVPRFPVIDINGIEFSHATARNYQAPFHLVAGRNYELTTTFSAAACC